MNTLAIISSVRNSHSSGLNSAAKMAANRKHSLVRDARKTVRTEQEGIATIGGLFSLENMTEEQGEQAEFWLNYLTDYGTNSLIESEHLDDDGEIIMFDPVRKALRQARSHENGKNRDNIMDVVGTCFVAFLSSLDCGADLDGNLVRKTELHKNAAIDKTDGLTTFGRDVVDFKIVENVNHLFFSCLRWSVKRVLKANSGSVDVSSTAERGYRQAYGQTELEQGMDATGILSDNDKKVRRDLSIGYTQEETARRNGMSRQNVRTSIGKLQTAARIVTKK
jgi:hypothetical protein